MEKENVKLKDQVKEKEQLKDKLASLQKDTLRVTLEYEKLRDQIKPLKKRKTPEKPQEISIAYSSPSAMGSPKADDTKMKIDDLKPSRRVTEENWKPRTYD